jgi:hypothetical protein
MKHKKGGKKDKKRKEITRIRKKEKKRKETYVRNVPFF